MQRTYYEVAKMVGWLGVNISKLTSLEITAQRKATGEKGPATELKPGTYVHSFAELQPHELSVPVANPLSPIALCTELPAYQISTTDVTYISRPHWWAPIRVKQLSVALPSLFEMTEKAITGSWSIGWSDHPQTAQHCWSAAVWFGVILPAINLTHTT